jgi:hypothetical protein
VLGLAAAAAAAVAVPASASASAPDGPSPVVGHVYVNDNTKPANTIGAFDRHADGTLTAKAGPPFAAAGAGTGSGLASQGALQFSADGRFLIAVDAGSRRRARSPPLRTSRRAPGRAGRQAEGSMPPGLRRPGMPPGRFTLSRW